MKTLALILVVVGLICLIAVCFITAKINEINIANLKEKIIDEQAKLKVLCDYLDVEISDIVTEEYKVYKKHRLYIEATQ